MDNQHSEYQKRYSEIELLGRGNYGSAYVVRSQSNGKLYVGKKMNLDGMTQAEIEGAKQQIQILKKFSDNNLYPFIVKYIESFYFERTLVIVMEFCQCGDLATYLKQAKKKGQLLDQKAILAWFVMLVMGIQALHSKNVLHRDLKSANVFLTSNKYVKIGDFGISKVLDSTSAKTFVGTPYYLSPEVCSNKKYDLRSDLWSLGCILYELCTLNYPFQANNILSLAMKITTEEVQPISKKYSKQLNDIVMGLLTKDQNKRKTLNQILNMPYMQKFMREYGGNIDQLCQKIQLKKSLKAQSIKTNESTIKNKQINNKQSVQSNQDTLKTIKSNFQKTNNNGGTLGNTSMKQDTLDYSMTGMSPKDLVKMRKQKKRQQQYQIMKQGARNAIQVKNFAKSKKQEQFGGSSSNFGQSMTLQAKNLHKKFQDQNKQIAQQKYQNKYGMNDKQSLNLEQLSQLCTLTAKMNGLTLTGNNTTNKPVNLDLTASVQKKLIATNQRYKAYTQTVQQQINGDDDQLQEYYDDDFQTYQNQQEKAEIANQNDVLKSCLKVFAGQKEQVSPSKLAYVQKTFQKKQIVSRGPKQKKQQCIKQCINLVKPQRYKLLYQLVSQGYNGQKYIQSQQLRELRASGSISQKKALKLIDLIKYYEMQQKNR